MAGAVSPGARHFHRIVRTLALICAVAYGIGVVASYVVYLQKLDEVATGRDIYARVKQFTSLTYYSIWFLVSLVAVAATFQKRYPMLPLYPLLAVLIEVSTFSYYAATSHRLFVAPAGILLERFDLQPYLQVAAHPGDLGMGVTHDSEGRRTTINAGKVASPRYVYVFGGSTTYDIGVVDAQTWPSRLSADLGPDFAVENYGLPLFSSLEAMLQSLFAFRDRAPVCAVYYLGANDVRNTHIRNLRVDYAELHSPSVIAVVQPGGRRSLLTTYSVFFATLDTIVNPPPPHLPFSGTTSDVPDPRLQQIVHDNIELITRITRSFGVKPIFVPEIPDYSRLTADAALDLPFVKDKYSKIFMDEIHATMKSAAEDAGGIYLANNLAAEWGSNDFVDQAHFSAQGAAKLADSISGDVRRLCQGE